MPVSTVALGASDVVVEVTRPGGPKERSVVAPDRNTGGAVLFLIGSALSSVWFRWVL